MRVFDTPLFPLGIAFFVSCVITRMIIALGILDHPNERSSHAHPTPNCGGIGILMGFGIGYFFISSDLGIFQEFLPVFIGSLFVAFLGLWDDLRSPPFYYRLAMQFIIVTPIVLFVPFLHTPLWEGFPQTLYVICVLIWIVGFMNAFNFMDGLNGLAGSAVLMVVLGVFLLETLFEGKTLQPMIFILGASTLGFLLFNFPKARIFMGDVGSLFLGYWIAILAVKICDPNFLGQTPPLPILFLWPLLFDSTLTVFLRLCQGKNIFKPHREFLFHRLHFLGWPHHYVTLFYVLLFSFQGVLIYVTIFLFPMPSVIPLGLSFVIYFFYASYLIVRSQRVNKKGVGNVNG